MKIHLQIFGILLLSIGIWCCQSEAKPDTDQQGETGVTTNPMDRLPNNEAGKVIHKAIDFAGGWDTWSNKTTFSFYKVIEYLDSTGQKERSLRQLHQYQLSPQFKARLSWEENGDKFLIINKGDQAWKYKNGEEMTDQRSKNQAWNSSFGSNYVVSMPFKLTDPGVILSYDGLDTLTEGKIVHAVKVEYEPGAGSTGGMHTWWYYFDKETCDLVANYLDYGEGHSFTSYEIFTKVDGIRIHQKRHSHISNAQKEVKHLRTVYTNEEMQFDVPLGPELFEPLESIKK